MKLGYLFSIIALVSVMSCTNNMTPPPIEQKSIRFEMIDNNEERINSIDILAFKADPNDNTKEYFAYRVKSDMITQGSEASIKEVVVTLLTGGSDIYSFQILANARQEIDALGEIAISTEKKEILQRIVAHRENKWIADPLDPNYTGFPMWGEVPQMQLTENTSVISGINMLRMLARVDVTIAPEITSKFKLKSVRVYNFSTYGRVAPITTADAWNGIIALKPSIPQSNIVTKGPILYDQLSEPDVSLKKGIYLFEASSVPSDQASKATCLVLGGLYDGQTQETFYRVNLADKGTNGEPLFWDLIRNYLYNISISKVSAPGQKTPEEAFNAQGVNITAEITRWEQGISPDGEIPGSHLFKISKGQFSLPMNQRTALDKDNKLTIFTDYSGGWNVLKIVDIEGDFIPASWLTVSRYLGPAGASTTIDLLADENATEIDRTAFIHIQSGRLIYVVKVLQTSIPELSLYITDSNAEDIGHMLFSSNVGSTVPAQRLNVDWAPRGRSVMVSSISVIGASDFDFGTGDAIEVGAIPGLNGSLSYNIQPPAMTPAEVAADPFKEKAIRVDFTVTNGVSYMSKAVFLQQKNFAAVPTVDFDYLMDGTEKSFIINANAPWEIEVTSDPDNLITELITTIGGQYEDKRDETVYFQIKNDVDPKIYSAEATLTIRSTNAERPFPDRTVTIKGYSIIPRKRFLTIGSSPNGFGYNFSGTAASNKLITTASNYGTLPKSVVKAEGFTIIDGGVGPSETQLREWLVTNPVDIVILGYDNSNITVAIAQLYLQFLESGGTVIACQDRADATVSGNFLRTVLGNNGITTSLYNGGGAIYRLGSMDNPILNGPFGDIRGLQWGEDASATVRALGIDPSVIEVLSGDDDISTVGSVSNPGYVTSFKHKTLNLIWFGDGGVNSNNAANDLTICPFKLDASFFPIPKATYGRGANRMPVYNSVITANAITWALKQHKK